ncbi:hypothetical protein L7F22_021104 [Adiantum nelumboides]|nr:hypothetical protein [Adiantum nelumboides]
MNQFLSHGASDQVLTAWRSLKLEEGENIQKYVEKFWDLHIKATVYKRINFSKQKQQLVDKGAKSKFVKEKPQEKGRQPQGNNFNKTGKPKDKQAYQGILAHEMGETHATEGPFEGPATPVTSLIGKLRLHVQGYADKEDFIISPLKNEDVLLAAPWFDCMAASLTFLKRKVTFKHKGRDITLHVNEKGHTIPLVSHDSFDKAMKSSISVYMIFVKDPPSELPPKRGDDDHRIDLIPGSSPPNKPPYRVSQAQQEEIMSQVNELVQKGMILEGIDSELSSFKCGLAHFFLQHTSASLTINENYDADVQADTETFLSRIVPEGKTAPWKHTIEGPDDMPAHIKSSMFGCTLTIPITNGKLNLGTWQGKL